MHFTKILIIVSLLLLGTTASAQETDITVGTIVGAGTHDGYTVVNPLTEPHVYLIDSEGRVINQWEVGGPGRDAFLRENGNLVVSVPRQAPQNELYSLTSFQSRDGRIQEYTWDGELVWDYEFDRPGYRVHHGINVMPNGNVQFIAWDYYTSEQAIANGRDPEQLGDGIWSEVILEYDPQADAIVWEWHLWDHLVQDFNPQMENYGDVAASPHLVDINFFEGYGVIEDWIHANAVHYNEALDQVVFSAREFNEAWVIDRNTTTQEATGPAGDLLYRWGNADAYQRGNETSHQLRYQHDIQWIDSDLPGGGNMIAFSNRHPLEDGGEPAFSRIVEWTPPLQEDGTYALEDGEPYGPAEPSWTWQAENPTDFFSNFISGVQRLRSGNTLITYGAIGRLWEVTPEGDIVWEYQLPHNEDIEDENNPEKLVMQGEEATTRIYRARRYEADYAAFDGRDMTPGLTLEARAAEGAQ